MEGFSIDDSEFPDFSGGNLLDSIDFDDLFLGISDGDVLPDLEMDPEILAEFSASVSEESDVKFPPSPPPPEKQQHVEAAAAASSSDVVSATSSPVTGEETVSTRDEVVGIKEADNGRKSMSHSKNPPGKRKVKVDWTPELHRRFVQAVEQLGVDKAVPSRILELMGIDCLTRHNIASHLQKYRSHRKHLLAREAEAASWSQRRQIYGGGGGGGAAAAGKREHANPWIAPTMGFPPVTPMPPHFRPLHVWGHPSLDQSVMPMWPKHLTPSPPPPPHAWPPAQLPPPADPSFWMPHHHHVQTQGTPCFPPPHLPPTTTTRFPTPPVPGIPPPAAMYKVEQAGVGGGVPIVPAAGQTLPQPPSDVHPSKESVDAAIGDVLTKPWLPLPLGLKPPSVDSVMVELQRQGVPKVPPSCA